MDWRLDSETVGLSLLTLAPGFASSEASPIAANEARVRALVETGIIAAVAAHVSKSWWPLAFPAFYLSYDWVWLRVRSAQKPEVIDNGY